MGHRNTSSKSEGDQVIQNGHGANG